MKQYIGTKLVEAEPATRYQTSEGVHIQKHSEEWREEHKRIPALSLNAQEGYAVRYPDGYESWSPKAVFEAAYLPLHVNRELPTDKPSISQEMVDDFIVCTTVTTMGEKTTVCRAVLRNGFEIVESSACVSKENYSEEMGYKICRQKIEDKVWMLLGFLLQTAVGGVDGEKVYLTIAEELMEAAKQQDGMSFGEAIEAVKAGKRIARKGWNGKGQYVELACNVAYVTPEGKEVNADHQAIGKKALAFCGTSGVQLGWLASQADMLAEDWKIVE